MSKKPYNPFDDYDETGQCYAALAVVCSIMLVVGFLVGLCF